MTPKPSEIGVYRVHSADSQQKDIPILYGAHMRTYSDVADPKGPKKTLAGNTKVTLMEVPGWTSWHLFEMALENERPDVAIASLDLSSGKTGTVPIFFYHHDRAVTPQDLNPSPT